MMIQGLQSPYTGLSNIDTASPLSDGFSMFVFRLLLPNVYASVNHGEATLPSVLKLFTSIECTFLLKISSDSHTNSIRLLYFYFSWHSPTAKMQRATLPLAP
jgi:hypothetical protein